MSNRFSNHHHNNNKNNNNNRNENNKKGFNKTKKQFITNGESSANQTLSNSLRQSLSRQSDATFAVAVCATAVAGSGRVKMRENGSWVSDNSNSNSGIQCGNYVNYLPQDEAVASGLGANEGGLDPVESQRVVDLLNRELSRLLKLKPRDFWKEVASDASLHAFLESFLKYKRRWYDFPYRGATGVVAGVVVGEFELCRRVIMVFYRISSNRDPDAKTADSLSSKDHAK